MKSSLYIFKFCVVACWAILPCSCKKFVAIEAAPNLINSEAVFTSDVTAIAAIGGVYVQMRQLNNSMTNGGLSLFTGLSGDEIYNTSTNPNYDPFYRDSVPKENSTILRNFWTDAYNNIYQTNAIIEGLSKSTALSEPLKKQLLGEAKVVRSLYYFYLVNLYGDVPLVVSTDYKVNEKMPRTPLTEVYLHITSDLLDAENLLSEDHPSAGKARPNKWTATALLARVYLYQRNWAQAEAKATAVINSGTYALVTDLNSVFLQESAETIWEIAPRNEMGNTVEGTNFIPFSPTVKPSFALTNSLMDSFEAGDQRRGSWIDSNTVDDIIYPYPFKYKSRMNTPVTEYNVVLRLAEQYLIRSEAWAQQGNLPDGRADLNKIRSRAGLPDAIAATQSELLAAIEQERKVELFTEWGHRWFDLKRTGRIDAVLSTVKPFWRSFAALYPIPLTQIQLNPFLTQNPGY